MAVKKVAITKNTFKFVRTSSSKSTGSKTPKRPKR